MITEPTKEAHISIMDDHDTEAISLLVAKFEEDLMDRFRKRQITCQFKEGRNAAMLTDLKFYDHSRVYTKDLMHATMF